MTVREEAIARQIRFSNLDFEDIFKAEGIDFYSLSEDEWRSFENMFMEGIQWSEVASIAASTIKFHRDADTI